MRSLWLTVGLLIGCTAAETPDVVDEDPAPVDPFPDPVRPVSIDVTPEPDPPPPPPPPSTPPQQPMIATSRIHCRASAIDVSWGRLPGNANDWVAIASADSAPGTYLQRVFTQGALNGTTTFTTPPPGKYVARAYLDDSPTVLAEFWFWIVSVTVDRETYAAGDPITITWAGLPGGSGDWVGLTPEGAVPPAISAGTYTNGSNGSHVFTLDTPGSYVSRAFESDETSIIACEGEPFLVGM